MNILSKNFIKIFLFILVLFTAVDSVSAQSFGKPIATIGTDDTCIRGVRECPKEKQKSIELLNFEPGDSIDVYVFNEYIAAEGSRPINNVRVFYDLDNIEAKGNSKCKTFTTSLSSGAGPKNSEPVMLCGLPESGWSISSTRDASVINTHGTEGSSACKNNNFKELNYYVEYNDKISSSMIHSAGHMIGNLLSGESNLRYCTQGTATVTYTITADATPTATTFAIDQNDVTQNSAVLKGSINMNDFDDGSPFFVWGQSENHVYNVINKNSYNNIINNGKLLQSEKLDDEIINSGSGNINFDLDVNGLETNETYYFRICVEYEKDSSNLDIECGERKNFKTGSIRVDTISATVSDRSVEFVGSLNSGEADRYWFEYSTSSSSLSSSCNVGNAGNKKRVYANYANSGFRMSEGGLTLNTGYFYRAGVTSNNVDYCGRNDFFYTSSSTTTTSTTPPSNGARPEATTERARDIEEDSAELNGEIDMNDFDNGRVFFVWGQDRSDVRDVERDNRYNDIRNDGHNLQRDDIRGVIRRSDGREDFRLDVDNLEENENYYFRICVEYRDNNDYQLECGSVRDFDLESDDEVEIETTRTDNLRETSVTICGDLVDNGGDRGIRTRMEFKRSAKLSWDSSSYRQRGEGSYCVNLNNLEKNTRYNYRACTDISGSDGERCGRIRNFTTRGNVDPVEKLIINTLDPSNVATSSAILNGAYTNGSTQEPTIVWFEWGTSTALGTKKRDLNFSVESSTFSDAFTGLRPCSRYYYRAVGKNSGGIVRGNTKSFSTGCINIINGPPIKRGPPKVIIEEEVEETEIDLSLLGLGLSLIRLDIDDSQEVVHRDQLVEYVVSWENISTIELSDIDIKVSIPKEISVANYSRGRFDVDENVIFYNIDDLESRESGSFVINGVVIDGVIGDLITAEATAAYDNPINDAQENATDYDVDEFTFNQVYTTASVFGLSNISFLGWFTILLGLLIIFLIARWLYLDREELRAQAYISGIHSTPMIAPNNSGGGMSDPMTLPKEKPADVNIQIQNQYGEKNQRVDLAGAQHPINLPGVQDVTNTDIQTVNDKYEPYRPNRN